jgi:hypothetical protein
VELEYRCPTHGIVEVDRDNDASVPVCSMVLRRTVEDEVLVERCGQPLTIYMKRSL